MISNGLITGSGNDDGAGDIAEVIIGLGDGDSEMSPLEDCVGVGVVDGSTMDGDSLGAGFADAEATSALDVAISALEVEMIVSGMTSGVAEWVASGIASGGIVSVRFEFVKIVSGLRRGSSVLGAGVSAELVASMGGDSWACTCGGAGSIEIHG